MNKNNKSKQSRKGNKSNKGNKSRVVRATKAPTSDAKKILGLSVCGFCRAAGKSGLTIQELLAVLTHFKAEHGGKTAANQRRWGVSGKDRQGNKIEELSAEQEKAIKPIIAGVREAVKAEKAKGSAKPAAKSTAKTPATATA